MYIYELNQTVGQIKHVTRWGEEIGIVVLFYHCDRTYSSKISLIKPEHLNEYKTTGIIGYKTNYGREIRVFKAVNSPSDPKESRIS